MGRSNVIWEILDKVHHLKEKGYLDSFASSSSEHFESQMRDQIHGLMLDAPENLSRLSEKDKLKEFIVTAEKIIEDKKVVFDFSYNLHLEKLTISLTSVEVKAGQETSVHIIPGLKIPLPNPEVAYRSAISPEQKLKRKITTNEMKPDQDKNGLHP